MNIRIKAIGQERVIADLSGYAKRIKNLQVPLKEISDYMTKQFKANFPAGGTVIGSRWPARKNPAPHPLMMRTGRLRSSWSSAVSPRQATITNPTPYGIYHQRGTRRMPSRPIVGHKQIQLNIMRQKLTNYINKK